MKKEQQNPATTFKIDLNSKCVRAHRYFRDYFTDGEAEPQRKKKLPNIPHTHTNKLWLLNGFVFCAKSCAKYVFPSLGLSDSCTNSAYFKMLRISLETILQDGRDCELYYHREQTIVLVLLRKLHHTGHPTSLSVKWGGCTRCFTWLLLAIRIKALMAPTLCRLL